MLLTYHDGPCEVLHVVWRDPVTEWALVQMSGLVHPDGVRVFGVMRHPSATRDQAVAVEDAFVRVAQAAGAKRLYAGCPNRLAAHYAQTYRGWQVVGPWQDPHVSTLVCVEKQLTEA